VNVEGEDQQSYQPINSDDHVARGHVPGHSRRLIRLSSPDRLAVVRWSAQALRFLWGFMK
jgi:translation initiation factor IF-1